MVAVQVEYDEVKRHRAQLGLSGGAGGSGTGEFDIVGDEEFSLSSGSQF